MTFNPCAGAAVQRAKQHLGKSPTVLELGSQTLTFRVPDHELKSTPDYYTLLGFSRYEAIDFDETGTIKGNLNESVWNGETFDLVTNSGTGEHIFNQANVFESVHNACKPGGVMLHILPWINWRNHGFYNFNPILFYDLAYENGYEVLEMSRADRNGKGLETVSFEEIKKPDATDVNWFVIASLKKVHAAPFKVPTQRKYRKEVVQTRPGYSEYKYNILSGLERIDAPFPVFVGKGPEGLYEILRNSWPEGGYEGRPGPNKLLQIKAQNLPRGFFEHVAQKHTSRAFLQDTLRLFGPDIPAAAKQYPLECGLRGSDAPFQMDVQAAINTPVTRKSSVRGPHVDDPKELISGLWYFPVEGDDAGGDLEIYRWKKGRKFIGRKGMVKKAEADPKAVELVCTIPYEPNTMVWFLNSPDSVHGVSPRGKTDKLRRYINFLVEVQQPLFELK